MGRADELLPVRRSSDGPPPPSVEMTADQRRLLAITEHRVPTDGADTRVIVYRPLDAPSRPPLILSLHAGAFCFGEPEAAAGRDAAWALRHCAVVVAVDYRLAPEHRFPAAVDDCFAALCWAVSALDVDRDRVVLAGISAGATLACAVAMMARDRSGPAVRYLALIIPPLDDRMTTTSMAQWRTAPLDSMSARQVEGMWLHYLGEDADRATTSPYAAPGRAADLAGLPDAYIQVHGRDPLRDEGLEFAARLLAAGVSVDLFCNGVATHSFEGLADPLNDEVLRTAVERALRPESAPLGRAAQDGGA